MATWLIACALNEPVAAQVDERTSGFVEAATSTLFEQLPKNDFAAERSFMAPELAETVSEADWKMVRKQFVEDAGSTPKYVPYQTTYYEQDTLLAAVDFFGQAAKANTFVCGFVVWKVAKNGEAKFIRLEQNVVPQSNFRDMPPQQAAQLLAEWRCPIDLIEKLLGVDVQ